MRQPVRHAYPAVLLLTCFAYGGALAHGIPAKEEQFAAGVPITDTQTPWPSLPLAHNGSGWHAARDQIPLDSILALTAANNDTSDHLLVIGTAGSLADQALMHRLMPERRSDYPNTRWVSAGGSASLIWEFNRRGEVIVQCLVSGHEQETPLRLNITPLTRP